MQGEALRGRVEYKLAGPFVEMLALAVSEIEPRCVAMRMHMPGTCSVAPVESAAILRAAPGELTI
jgi:hypothetical protein